jgi:hypothetical protein
MVHINDEDKKPTVLEVHRIVQYLTFGTQNVDKVKFCPDCLVCSIVKNRYTNMYICQCCGEFSLEKDIQELDVYDYLAMIRSLPLKNRGKPYVLSANRTEVFKLPERSYDDLDYHEILDLEKQYFN